MFNLIIGEIMEITNWMKLVLDSLYDGILIVDNDAVVRYINPAYTRITKVAEFDIIGKELLSVRPGAKLPNVVARGAELLRIFREEQGIQYVVNMSSVIVDGEVRGGISVVIEINDVQKLADELEKSNILIDSLKKQVKSVQKAPYVIDDIIAVDRKTVELKKFVTKIAKQDSDILITGASGTGKELYASALHNLSSRREEPYVAVNCASLSRELLESELFGYEDGIFTGAKAGGRIGLFEVADGGTIFLDEISEMDITLQAKLLRVLQEKTIRRIGGAEEIPVDVRVVAATNTDLLEQIDAKIFRADLYYRIAVVPLTTIPLQERKNDIRPLAYHFLSKFERQVKRRIDISDNALDCLACYCWPGNVRELKNALEFSANMIDEYTIDVEHLPHIIQRMGVLTNTTSVRPLKDIVAEFEKHEISKAIDVFGDTVDGKKKAAKILGISLATLYNKS